MKSLAIATIACLLATPAAAQSVRWDGFYGGASVGYGFTRGDHAQTNGGMPWGPYDVSGDGVVAGISVGHNLIAFDRILLGTEIEGGWMGAKGKGRIPSSDPAHHQDIDVDAGFYGMLAGRLGLALDGKTLIYGKGGYAMATSTSEQRTTKPGFVTHGSDSLRGFVYGAGVEHAIDGRVSVKLEWVRFDWAAVTGDQTSVTDDPIGFVYKNKTDVHTDTIKLGVNVRF